MSKLLSVVVLSTGALTASAGWAQVTYTTQTRTVEAKYRGGTGPDPILDSLISAPNFAPFIATASTTPSVQFGPPNASAGSQNSSLNVGGVAASLTASFPEGSPAAGTGSSSAGSLLSVRLTLPAGSNFTFSGTWTSTAMNLNPTDPAIELAWPTAFNTSPDRSKGRWSLTRVGGAAVFSETFSWLDNSRWWRGGAGGSKTLNVSGFLPSGSYDFVLDTRGASEYFRGGGGWRGQGNNSLNAVLAIPSGGAAGLLGLGMLAAARRRR